MALFAALLYYQNDQYWTGDAEAEHMAGYAQFEAAASEAGVLRGGTALAAPGTAATVTVAARAGGDATITDGPFAETKEILGGLVLLDVADRDEALHWATRIPASWRGRVEVRPVAATWPHQAGSGQRST